ncbi:MAG: hypothetical protein LBU11_02685 [Zoogloeaceae bacterium]|nr:hypothetical protein [Zoogloeaceae bacterium]
MDTWRLSIPDDWAEKEPLGAMEEGVLYFESSDGEKAMYIFTWNLGEGGHPSARDVADSFKATEIETLHNMEGYSWQIMDERLAQHETSVTVASRTIRYNFHVGRCFLRVKCWERW